MMQITEDTPADMLVGAMDLTVHLPNGKTVKMSVERSTPMMDLLVQITTAHHLQLSEYIVQALEMAPTSDLTDRILPYKPNTPIGLLDTQHVRVVRKSRTAPRSIPKVQPFESTFRLQVHLPRNQLFVIRVGQSVLLQDIMRKVCDEKNLDVAKYEFRHPGNLDEVLDPKLTLSDYQITEVYIVSKGTVGHSFSANDIMALRKEEERKQHARTGGGVFSLIFKRGKNSMGSGSLSSENRSISPSHSDDSRSVTPPAIQQTISVPPKVPQRKRRPAPKPPQKNVDATNSQISNVSDTPSEPPKREGLTICHSRNSSDSSGYHEPSVLSEQCNTSLPRRPKSEIVDNATPIEHPNGNLSKMSLHSKSTTSLTSRKKKAAPPPPVKSPEIASPVVASPTIDEVKPLPRSRISKSPKALTVDAPHPFPRTFKHEKITEEIDNLQDKPTNVVIIEGTEVEIREKSVETKENPPKDFQGKTHFPKAFKLPIGRFEKGRRIRSSNTFSEVSDKESIQRLSAPSIVALIPKTDSMSSFDSFTTDLFPNHSNISTPIADVDFAIFKTFQRSISVITNSELKMQKIKSDLSITSLNSEEIPTFASVKKWRNLQNLNIPVNDKGLNWVLGDNSDEESPTPIPQNAKQDFKPPTPPSSISELSSITQSEIEDQRDFPSQKENLKANVEIPAENKTPENSPESKNEFEWEYQLPPPPSAFRDTIPISTNCYEGFPDGSVVTNPELFEKLQQIRDEQEDQSESMLSEDEKPILSKLNLETLEKRKSLVYNRELSTSLKNVQNSETETIKPATVLQELEETLSDPQRKTKISRSSSSVEQQKETLPNFKITTYNPKEKISIFEDDSIRSNSEHAKTENSENSEDSFKKPPEFGKYKTGARANFYRRNETFLKVTRSESFSNQNGWKPLNPVKRSKSQIALNKPDLNPEPICKSNSLYDVSGLQSLEVMRMIQSKLSTPSNSTEQLDESPTEKLEKTYQYHGPPSINLSTWSERPKTKVALKEDADYKINNSVSIKVNGESNQKFGNVVIRIGNQDKFLNGNSVTFRKPLGNVNKIEGRPHSISFAPDISRVPIVRAVELKKSFKEPVNTSITHITNDSKYSDLYHSSESINELKELKPQTRHSLYIGGDSNSKQVLRVNSFQSRVSPVVLGFKHENIPGNRKSWNIPSYQPAPVPPNKPPEVPPKSFITNSNVPFSQNTLRRTEFKNVRNETMIPKPILPATIPIPPKCPTKNLSIITPEVDSRAQLLDSIRNFGGKGGLRSIKA